MSAIKSETNPDGRNDNYAVYYGPNDQSLLTAGSPPPPTPVLEKCAFLETPCMARNRGKELEYNAAKALWDAGNAVVDVATPGGGCATIILPFLLGAAYIGRRLSRLRR